LGGKDCVSLRASSVWAPVMLTQVSMIITTHI